MDQNIPDKSKYLDLEYVGCKVSPASQASKEPPGLTL